MKRIPVHVESEKDFAFVLLFLREALKDPNAKEIFCEIQVAEKDVLPEKKQKKETKVS